MAFPVHDDGTAAAGAVITGKSWFLSAKALTQLCQCVSAGAISPTAFPTAQPVYITVDSDGDRFFVITHNFITSLQWYF